MNKSLWIIVFITVAALLLVLVSLSGPDTSDTAAVPPALQKLLLPEPRPLREFALRDHLDRPLGLAQLQGHWSLLFFGYTHCPDICPTTLGVLKGVAKRLEAQPQLAATTRFLFVSVDPQRDSLPHLREYIGFFHPDFIAATGERKDIDNLLRQLGGVYMFEGDTSKDDYLVNHSVSVALIDPQGHWVARFNPPLDSEAMHDHYLQIRNYLQPEPKDR